MQLFTCTSWIHSLYGCAVFKFSPKAPMHVMPDVCMYLDLFYSRPLEAQIEAVVSQWPYLRVVTIVAHADDGNLWTFDQTDHLLQEARCQRSVSRKHGRGTKNHSTQRTHAVDWLSDRAAVQHRASDNVISEMLFLQVDLHQTKTDVSVSLMLVFVATLLFLVCLSSGHKSDIWTNLKCAAS